jgi:hypothetical protein
VDVIFRLLLRFILVPLGYLAAVLVGSCVILFGSWRFAEMMVSAHPDALAYGVFGAAVAGPILFVILFSVMWLPGAIGILIAEAFAIRSWIFHALNGAISAWVGTQLLSNLNHGEALNETTFIFGAGLAGGFAYWAVAGWNAGFWKPVFARPALSPPPAPAVPAPSDPFNPPGQTRI